MMRRVRFRKKKKHRCTALRSLVISAPADVCAKIGIHKDEYDEPTIAFIPLDAEEGELNSPLFDVVRKFRQHEHVDAPTDLERANMTCLMVASLNPESVLNSRTLVPYKSELSAHAEAAIPVMDSMRQLIMPEVRNTGPEPNQSFTCSLGYEGNTGAVVVFDQAQASAIPTNLMKYMEMICERKGGKKKNTNIGRDRARKQLSAIVRAMGYSHNAEIERQMRGTLKCSGGIKSWDDYIECLPERRDGVMTFGHPKGYIRLMTSAPMSVERWHEAIQLDPKERTRMVLGESAVINKASLGESDVDIMEDLFRDDTLFSDLALKRRSGNHYQGTYPRSYVDMVKDVNGSPYLKCVNPDSLVGQVSVIHLGKGFEFFPTFKGDEPGRRTKVDTVVHVWIPRLPQPSPGKGGDIEKADPWFTSMYWVFRNIYRSIIAWNGNVIRQYPVDPIFSRDGDTSGKPHASDTFWKHDWYTDFPVLGFPGSRTQGRSAFKQSINDIFNGRETNKKLDIPKLQQQFPGHEERNRRLARNDDKVIIDCLKDQNNTTTYNEKMLLLTKDVSSRLRQITINRQILEDSYKDAGKDARKDAGKDARKDAGSIVHQGRIGSCGWGLGTSFGPEVMNHMYNMGPTIVPRLKALDNDKATTDYFPDVSDVNNRERAWDFFFYQVDFNQNWWLFNNPLMLTIREEPLKYLENRALDPRAFGLYDYGNGRLSQGSCLVQSNQPTSLDIVKWNFGYDKQGFQLFDVDEPVKPPRPEFACNYAGYAGWPLQQQRLQAHQVDKGHRLKGTAFRLASPQLDFKKSLSLCKKMSTSQLEYGKMMLRQVHLPCCPVTVQTQEGYKLIEVLNNQTPEYVKLRSSLLNAALVPKLYLCKYLAEAAEMGRGPLARYAQKESGHSDAWLKFPHVEYRGSLSSIPVSSLVGAYKELNGDHTENWDRHVNNTVYRSAFDKVSTRLLLNSVARERIRLSSIIEEDCGTLKPFFSVRQTDPGMAESWFDPWDPGRVPKLEAWPSELRRNDPPHNVRRWFDPRTVKSGQRQAPVHSNEAFNMQQAQRMKHCWASQDKAHGLSFRPRCLAPEFLYLNMQMMNDLSRETTSEYGRYQDNPVAFNAVKSSGPLIYPGSGEVANHKSFPPEGATVTVTHEFAMEFGRNHNWR